MVYKKYIEKDGKIYGPYVYKSHRVDGKIVSEYCGPSVNKKKVFVFAVAALVLFLLIFLLFFYNKFTGNVISENSAPVSLNLEKSVTYPVVYFTLISIQNQETEIPENNQEIIPEQNTTIPENFSQEEIQENSSEQEEVNSSSEIIPEETNQTEEPNEEVNPEQEEAISSEVTEETPSEIEEPEEQTPISEEPSDNGVVSEVLNNVANFFLGFLKSTGMVVSGQKTEVKISGKVSLNEPFVYDLNEGETVQLLSGSVKTDLYTLPDNAVKLTYKDNLVIISTNYSELSELKESPAENTTLIIEKRENAVLTEQEKIILLEYFGNSSVKTVKSELFNGRYVLGYELGEFNIEYSYDSALDNETLATQIEIDKNKWLKDISAKLTEKESVHEEVNLS
jgi:hypothetical protein